MGEKKKIRPKQAKIRPEHDSEMLPKPKYAPKGPNGGFILNG